MQQQPYQPNSDYPQYPQSQYPEQPPPQYPEQSVSPMPQAQPQQQPQQQPGYYPAQQAQYQQQPGYYPAQQAQQYPQPGYYPAPQYPQPGYPPQQAPQYPQPGYLPQQAPQYPQQMQQGYAGVPQPYPGQQPMMQTHLNVNLQQKNGPGFLVRALYFLFIGWWAGFIWLNIGFGFCAMIFTLPIGLMMLNRVPKIMTLQPDSSSTSVNVSTVNVQQPYGSSVMVQNVNIHVGGAQQVNFLVRALYYLFVGWWAGFIWAYLAYACCMTFFLLPVGVIMFNSLPTVLTLRKN